MDADVKLLTICIPTFNRREKLIPHLEYLYSILEMHCLLGIVEIFVSDNNSTDGTYEALRPYFSRIRYHRQNVNIGGDKNFIFLYENVRTQYMFLLSDDDRIQEKGLLKSIHGILEYKPDLILCQFITNGVCSFPEKIKNLCNDTVVFNKFNSINLFYFISSFILKKPSQSIDVQDIMNTNFMHVEYLFKCLDSHSKCLVVCEPLVERIEVLPIVLSTKHWQYDLSGSRVARKYQKKFNLQLSPIAELTSSLSFFSNIKMIQATRYELIIATLKSIGFGVWYTPKLSLLYAPLYIIKRLYQKRKAQK